MGLFRRKTPSLGAAAPQVPTRSLLSRNHKEDVPCACGYNLRGLSFGTKCPECGRDTRLYWESHVAFNSGQSEEAVSFVLDAVRWLSKRSKGSHIAAVDVCQGVCRVAIGQCGSEPAAREMLSDILGLARSEPIGAIVFALVECGILYAAPEDSPDDFDSLPLWPPSAA